MKDQGLGEGRLHTLGQVRWNELSCSGLVVHMEDTTRGIVRAVQMQTIRKGPASPTEQSGPEVGDSQGSPLRGQSGRSGPVRTWAGSGVGVMKPCMLPS